MSWPDKIQNDFLITCGDGKQYKVNWLNATKSVEFNLSEFEFPGLEGTLVQRGTPKGRRFEIEVYFQGENNIDVSDAFEISTKDPRPWIVLHPMYGTITVQPAVLNFDDTRYNVTKITGTLLETITEDSPKNRVVPSDKILNDKAALDDIFSNSFANDIPSPSVQDINVLSANTLSVYNEGKKSIKDTADAEGYFNAFNTANAAIANATSEPLAAINAVQAMINAPALFQDSVKNRVNSFVGQLNQLRISLETITTRAEKKIFENNTGCIISAIAMASVTSPDYLNNRDVLAISDLITDAYDTYVEDLDGLQSDNGGSPDSYMPDANSMIGLNNIINFTLSNLFDIALNSKQERSIILEDDSNIILLAHRFYGLNQEDTTIDDLMNQNEIGLNEILSIRKGRKIVYYV
jgi:hypothetical protein